MADFQIPQTVKAAIDRHIAEKNEVNILVNNTGGPKAGNAQDATTEDFLQAFNSHLVCNQLLTMAVIPSMKSTGLWAYREYYFNICKGAYAWPCCFQYNQGSSSELVKNTGS